MARGFLSFFTVRLFCGPSIKLSTCIDRLIQVRLHVALQAANIFINLVFEIFTKKFKNAQDLIEWYRQFVLNNLFNRQDL